MARFRLSRRTLLRGAAGAAVALPPLEIMLPRRARAQQIPKRFLMAYGGVSIGGLQQPIEKNLVIPRTKGRGYELTPGLEPIGGDTVGSETYPSVKNDVGIISGLKIPWGNPIPPAGKATMGFHGQTLCPQVSGEAVVAGANEEDGGDGTPRGSTADQIVAGFHQGATPLGLVNLLVQAAGYLDNYKGDTISYKNGSARQATYNVRQAYNELFSTGGQVNGRTINVAAFIDRRQSILDAVLEKSRRLGERLGGEDRMRLDKYYTEVRAFEKRLEDLQAKGGTTSCTPMTAPEDPPVGFGYTYQRAVTEPGYNPDEGWSNEELRAQIMGDYLHLVFSCDLSRSAVFHLTSAQSYMNSWHITPTLRSRYDLHSTGHGYRDAGVTVDQNQVQIAEIVAWHVKHFARLAAKLKSTMEADGRSVLDHSAMFMLWEGGHGGHGIPGRPGNDSHSTENMIAIVAGGAGGLRSGQHIHYDNDKHPGQVALTHMKAVGLPDSQRLGDISEGLQEPFSIA